MYFVLIDFAAANLVLDRYASPVTPKSKSPEKILAAAQLNLVPSRASCILNDNRQKRLLPVKTRPTRVPISSVLAARDERAVTIRESHAPEKKP